MLYPPAKMLLIEKRPLGPEMMPLILPSGPMQVHSISSMPPALSLQRSMMSAFLQEAPLSQIGHASPFVKYTLSASPLSNWASKSPSSIGIPSRLYALTKNSRRVG